ncbi:MAG: hypothetical protein WA542_03225 [Candidatus Acidiferrum sp.]
MFTKATRGSVATIAFAVLATVAASGAMQPIAVYAEPTARVFEQAAEVTVKLTITINGPGEISFLTCSDLVYSVEVDDSQGVRVPRSVPLPGVEKDGELVPPADPTFANLVNCESNILVTLKPGKSWTETISLVGYIELESPGSYTGRIVLLPGKLSVVKVSSNSFQFAVRPKT